MVKNISLMKIFHYFNSIKEVNEIRIAKNKGKKIQGFSPMKIYKDTSSLGRIERLFENIKNNNLFYIIIPSVLITSLMMLSLFISQFNSIFILGYFVAILIPIYLLFCASPLDEGPHSAYYVIGENAVFTIPSNSNNIEKVIDFSSVENVSFNSHSIIFKSMENKIKIPIPDEEEIIEVQDIVYNISY